MPASAATATQQWCRREYPRPRSPLWIALALRHRYRDHFVIEKSVLPCRGSFMVRGGGERALFFASDAVGAAVARLSQHSHGLAGEDVVQAVVCEVIGQWDFAVLESRPRPFEHVRC